MKVVPIRCDDIRYHDSHIHLYRVPDGQYLMEGDLVLIETRVGIRNGYCECDCFDLDESPIRFFKKMFGDEELKPVVGKLITERWEASV